MSALNQEIVQPVAPVTPVAPPAPEPPEQDDNIDTTNGPNVMEDDDPPIVIRRRRRRPMRAPPNMNHLGNSRLWVIHRHTFP